MSTDNASGSTSPALPKTDRRARRHAATREEILTAAWQVAGEQGLAGMSLSEVAARVDMRAPSLYVYFTSKNALYDALFAQGAQRFLAAYRERLNAMSDDPPTRMRQNYQFFFDFCTSDRERYLLLFQRTIPGFAPSEESYRAAVEALSLVAQDFSGLGVCSQPGDLDLITAVITGLVDQQISNDPGGKRWQRLTDRAADMVYGHLAERRESEK
jgi:AcrR family transcriptional regulator